MKCPHCGRKLPTPTPAEIEAYRLVHIHGCTQKEAGVILGVSRTSITMRLARLKVKRPDLFDLPVNRVNRKNILSYDTSMSYRILRQF